MTTARRSKNSYDLTPELRLAESMLKMHRGLYVQYFENPRKRPVHDRNGELQGIGKKIISGKGASIKFGKYENGFLARRAQDAIHMHHRPANGSVPPPYNEEFIYPPALGTYMECLQRIYVLDLGSTLKGDVSQAEKCLGEAIDEFLKGQDGLRIENYRGDWRLIDGHVPPGFWDRFDKRVKKTFDYLRRNYPFPKSGLR